MAYLCATRINGTLTVEGSINFSNELLLSSGTDFLFINKNNTEITLENRLIKFIGDVGEITNSTIETISGANELLINMYPHNLSDTRPINFFIDSGSSNLNVILNANYIQVNSYIYKIKSLITDGDTFLYKQDYTEQEISSFMEDIPASQTVTYGILDGYIYSSIFMDKSTKQIVTDRSILVNVPQRFFYGYSVNSYTS